MNRHTVAHAWSREQGWIAARTAQWAFYWAVKKQETTIFQKNLYFYPIFFEMGITKTDNAENIPSAVMVVMPPAIESTTADSQTPTQPFYKKHLKLA